LSPSTIGGFPVPGLLVLDEVVPAPLELDFDFDFDELPQAASATLRTMAPRTIIARLV
jgi:hypothetical protein